MVVVLQVPGDGVGPGVEAFAGSSVRRATMRSMVAWGSRVGLLWGRRARSSKAASPSRVYRAMSLDIQLWETP
jgi:hypothetical protein